MASNTYTSGALGLPDANRGHTGNTVWITSDTQSDRVKAATQDNLANIYANRAPFSNMLDRTGKVSSVPNMTFKSLQQWEIQVDVLTNAGTLTAAATTLTFDTTSYMRDRDVMLNLRTFEQILVYNVASATTATVRRNYNSSGAQVLADNDPWLIVSTSLEEAQNKPETVMRGTDSLTLYTQHQGHAVGHSEWAALTGVYGPGEHLRLDMQATKHFKEMRERALLFSQPGAYTDATSGLLSYTQAGLLYLSRLYNRVDFNGILSWDTLCAAIRFSYTYGESRTRYMLCSGQVIDALQRIPEVRNSLRTPPGMKSIGFDVSEIICPSGRLRFVEHHEFNRTGLEDLGIVFSLSNLGRRTFSGEEGRDGIETPGSYREEWSLSVNEGLETDNPMALSCFENLLG